MPKDCRFQQVKEGKIYCGIWDQNITDTYRGETNEKLCKSCVVPENPCKGLSVRTQFQVDLGRTGVFAIASCEMKKKKLKLPEDCFNCPNYTF